MSNNIQKQLLTTFFVVSLNGLLFRVSKVLNQTCFNLKKIHAVLIVISWVKDKSVELYNEKYRYRRVVTSCECLLQMWSHQANPSAWVYVIYCESVQYAP